MPVFSYLMSKQKSVQSKYHQVSKRIESKYELIHWKLKSRFHREPIETELIRYKIKNLITQSKDSIESKINSTKLMPSFSTMSIKKRYSFNSNIIDWFQGRFSGQVIKIIIREGNIIERIYLSPNGNQISVKRSKLELRIRSISTIQINFRLRIKSLPILYRNLKLQNI
tara:strand:- start:54 stop:560 length:507 start_codon:yes stop_codon:yes gene_type:complete